MTCLSPHTLHTSHNIVTLCQIHNHTSTTTDTKLTYLPFVIKALGISLAKFPGLNVTLEPGHGALLQHHSHNIGVAMATSNGLVVPNIKQVGLCVRVRVRLSGV